MYPSCRVFILVRFLYISSSCKIFNCMTYKTGYKCTQFVDKIIIIRRKSGIINVTFITVNYQMPPQEEN